MTRRPVTRTLAWGATFVAFPIGGLAAMWSAGAIDDPLSATIGGAVVGTVVGLAQALGSRAIDAERRLDPRRWVPATAAGMSIGLAAASALVGYGTTLADLATMGALTGVAVGVAQAFALPRALAPRLGSRLLWAAAVPVVLATGWTVTTLAGVGVDQRFAVFGATGALVATALTGGLLAVLAASARRADRDASARGVIA